MHTAASKLGFNKDPAPDAPQKSSSSDKLSREEAISAATYEPSGDLLANDSETESDTSCDYETEVLKAIGADTEPSQGGELTYSWLAAFMLNHLIWSRTLMLLRSHRWISLPSKLKMGLQMIYLTRHSLKLKLNLNLMWRNWSTHARKSRLGGQRGGHMKGSKRPF